MKTLPLEFLRNNMCIFPEELRAMLSPQQMTTLSEDISVAVERIAIARMKCGFCMNCSSKVGFAFNKNTCQNCGQPNAESSKVFKFLVADIVRFALSDDAVYAEFRRLNERYTNVDGVA